MNAYENFRLGILKRAAFATNQCYSPLLVQTFKEAADFAIPEPHICEQLLQLKDSRLISLAAFDGLRERPFDEWPNVESFFFNRTDSGHVRIRLLSAGAELLSD